jgi:hypothetical protein
MRNLKRIPQNGGGESDQGYYQFSPLFSDILKPEDVSFSYPGWLSGGGTNWLKK